MPEHRVHLVEAPRALEHLLDGEAQRLGDGLRLLRLVGEEFVERRVQEADRDGQAVHRLEDPDEVLALALTELVQDLGFLVLVGGEDEALDER